MIEMGATKYSRALTKGRPLHASSSLPIALPSATNRATTKITSATRRVPRRAREVRRANQTVTICSSTTMGEACGSVNETAVT